MLVEMFLNSSLCLPKYPKELGDEVLELKVAEHFGVIVLVEDKLEVFVVYYLLYFAYVVLEVNTLELEAELEVLVVEDSNAGLRVVNERFDHPCWVD